MVHYTSPLHYYITLMHHVCYEMYYPPVRHSIMHRVHCVERVRLSFKLNLDTNALLNQSLSCPSPSHQPPFPPRIGYNPPQPCSLPTSTLYLPPSGPSSPPSLFGLDLQHSACFAPPNPTPTTLHAPFLRGIHEKMANSRQLSLLRQRLPLFSPVEGRNALCFRGRRRTSPRLCRETSLHSRESLCLAPHRRASSSLARRRHSPRLPSLRIRARMVSPAPKTGLQGLLRLAPHHRRSSALARAVEERRRWRTTRPATRKRRRR